MVSLSRVKRSGLTSAGRGGSRSAGGGAGAGGAASSPSPWGVPFSLPISTSSAALLLLSLGVLYLLLGPRGSGQPPGATELDGLSRNAVVNQSTADEINRLVLKFKDAHGNQPAEGLGGGGFRKSRAESSLVAVFVAANTAFKYHMQQRAASFIRDRVGPEDKLRWTQAKMREIFLVPVYSCPVEIRVGEWGEGGKWLCNIYPFRHALRVEAGAARGKSVDAAGPGYARRLDWRRAPVVYSVGSRDETSFEEAIYRLLNVRPYTMDPSLDEKKQAHLKTLPFMSFYNVGLTGATKKRGPSNWGPLMRFTEAMAMLNHTYVDVLKIDCESCEIGVMEDLFAQFGSRPPVGQVLMEIHHLFIPKVELDLLLLMEKLGFRMFHSENNERYSKAHEVAYIHESLVDPALWPPALSTGQSYS